MITIEGRSALERTPAHRLALDCVVAGIEAAHPDRVVEASVDLDGDRLIVTAIDGEQRTYDLGEYDDVFVVGGGNAAGHLARALEAVLGDRISGGVVVTDDPTDTEYVDVLEGDHPVPSERGVESTRRLLDVAERADENDLVFAAITGGGSALLPAPAGDVPLDDLQATTEALLASGATIHEINAVRKHISAIKGGQLARVAAPATVVGLIISDVIGDDLEVIASGPMSPDPTSYADALSVLDRYDVSVPTSVRDRLKRGDRGDLPETPDVGDPIFDRVDPTIVANGLTAIDAAREVADSEGYGTILLSSRIRGEASEAAKTQVAIAEESRATGNPIEPPAVVLSGGETTVTLVDDHGTGGPNQEFALSAAIELDDPDTVLASVDTDGIDGATDLAGAIVDAQTVDDDRAVTALARNDATPLLEEAGALIETGPSGTNVNDLRVLVIEDRSDR